MKGFLLTTIPTGGLRVVSQEPAPRRKGWDEYSIVVEAPLTEAQLRAKFPMGHKLNKGLGFYLEDFDFSHAGAGLNRATLLYRGLFARKVWGEPGASVATRQMEDLKIGSSTTVAKASVLDVTPTFTAHIYDAVAPPYSELGAKAVNPPAGLSWPVPASTGPWRFWGSYVPTTNVLGGTTTSPTAIAIGGWGMTDLQADEIEGESVFGGLYGKRQTYTLFWPEVP
jgi:hypothetical protein